MAVRRGGVRMAVVAVGVSLIAAACGGGGDAEDETSAAPSEDSAADEAAGDGDPAGDEAEPAGGDGEVLASITVGMNNPNYATQLPTILAEEWGYLAEEGIDEIEIINTDDYIPALIGGSLHITQGDTDVAIGSAEASQAGISFLGTYRNSEYRILAGAEGIEEPADLVGGTIVTGSEDGRTYLATYSAVEAIGLDPETDVEFVTTGGASDAWAQQLMNGQVQGSAIFPRHIAIVEAAGANILYNEQFEVPQEGVMVLDSFLETERATVVAFLRATLRARQDLQDLDRQDEILDIMRDNEFEIPEEFETAYPLEVAQLSPDGGFDAGIMDDFVAEQVELGNLPAEIDWRQYVDLGPLHEAQDSIGLEPNPADLG